MLNKKKIYVHLSDLHEKYRFNLLCDGRDDFDFFFSLSRILLHKRFWSLWIIVSVFIIVIWKNNRVFAAVFFSKQTYQEICASDIIMFGWAKNSMTEFQHHKSSRWTWQIRTILAHTSHYRNELPARKWFSDKLTITIQRHIIMFETKDHY